MRIRVNARIKNLDVLKEQKTDLLKPGHTEQLIEVEAQMARSKKATREYLASLTQQITGRKYAAGAVKRLFYKRHELNRARCVMTCSGKW